MLVATSDMLNQARQETYSVGAFNVYNLEEVQAVVETAESLKSPVILQILPSALALGGCALIKLCQEAGRQSAIPVSVHLDHSSGEEVIALALDGGISSVMADGSHLHYEENLRFTRSMVRLAAPLGATVEAELGRLTGTEDGLPEAQYEARLTDPNQAADFVSQTGAAALAVCIGNVHGRYKQAPELDFERLEAIENRVDVPLVLHGTSGLPDEMIRRSIELGICKFNVNTELRQAYLRAARGYLANAPIPELVDLMRTVINGVKGPVGSKIKLFGSAGKAVT